MLKKIESMVVVVSMAGWFASGCAGDRESSCEGFDETPRGAPSQYTLVSGGAIGSVAVSPPVFCEKERAYIRLEKAQGARRLGTARSPSGGFREGCLDLPGDPADLSQCPVLNFRPLLKAAFDELKERGVSVNGIGVGPCGVIGDYEELNESVGVVGWEDADAAVQLVAELLERYAVKGYVGVMVVGIRCVELN